MNGCRGTVLLISSLALAGCESTALSETVLGALLESTSTVTGDVIDGTQVEGARRLMDGTTDTLCANSSNVICRNLTATLVQGFSTEFVRRMTQRDVDLMGEARRRSVESGEEQSWDNPESGSRGTVIAMPAARKPPAPTPIKIERDKVEALPPMDAIGEAYVVTSSSTANMRSGPATTYPVVGSLQSGQVVQAIARVRDKNWFLVGATQAASGYVFGTLVAPQPASDEPIVDLPAPPEVDIEDVTVSMASDCYTTQQTIVLADGATEQAEVTSCRTPNGWVQV